MPLDPMSNHCLTCGGPMVPVLLPRPKEAPGHPLSADVPVVMRCPACTPAAATSAD